MNQAPNPYAPTIHSLNEKVEPTRGGSLRLAFAVGFGAFAYIVFTILLLNSTPLDRKAGLLFLPNCIVLSTMTFAVTRSTRNAMFLGWTAVLTQSAITVVMILFLGMPPSQFQDVIKINAGIALPMVLLSLACLWHWRTYRPGRRKGEAVDTELESAEPSASEKRPR